MATGLARSLLQRTLGRPCLRPLASRLASGEAYVPEKPPVEGKTENLKLVHAINNALDIAMESDSTAARMWDLVEYFVAQLISETSMIEVARKLCLSMCHQIVKGMAHIAEKLFVHCDLAARNCLIGGDGVVKVSDFGLAAILNPGHNQYLRPPGAPARVPIKWMAPESIEHRGLFYYFDSCVGSRAWDSVVDGFESLVSLAEQAWLTPAQLISVVILTWTWMLCRRIEDGSHSMNQGAQGSSSIMSRGGAERDDDDRNAPLSDLLPTLD